MEAIIRQQNGINPTELNEESYIEYCRLYLIQRVYEVLSSYGVEYGNIYRLINAIDPSYFDSLITETGKILLINKIYSIFMATYNMEISREYLYQHAENLAKYNPSLYRGN